jgi:transcriptional regulator with XRE-family HTH domain
VTTQTKPARRPVRPGQAASQVGGLAAALREWRGRRRVSQLELALRAGTTQRHVSFIESGRSVPGRAMVVRLAESLEVPLRERNALLLAAGYAPAYPETHLGDPGLGPVRAALERILAGHQPYPAVIVDRHGDLVAANDGFGALTAGVAHPARQRAPRAPAPAGHGAAHHQPRRVGLARDRPASPGST